MTASVFLSVLFPANSLLCVEYLSLLSRTRIYEPRASARQRQASAAHIFPSSLFLHAFALARPFDDEPSRRTVNCLSGVVLSRVSPAAVLVRLRQPLLRPAIADRLLRLAIVSRPIAAVSHPSYILQRASPYFPPPISCAFSLVRDRGLLPSRTTSGLLLGHTDLAPHSVI